ncbi:MAG: hypothetical protein Q7T63_07395 [Burkholderiaceae bacterium]|nr:hypothetical protein [Burkholderiaceae bacterium]
MNALSTWITANQAAVWNEIQTDPTWAFLKATTRDIFDLIEVVKDRGWLSAEQAAADIAPLNAWAKHIEPATQQSAISFTRDDLPTVPWIDVYGAVSQAAKSPVIEVRFAAVSHADVTYGLLTFDQIEELGAKTPSSAFKYLTEVMDCDDFSDIMTGWLASNGLGNASVGIANYNAYGSAGYIDAHAALIAVDTNHAVWWIEPQTGQVHALTDMYIFLTADRLWLTDLSF